MKLIKISLSLTLLPLSAFASNSCMFVLDPASVKVEWTGFKTTEKTPVKGMMKNLKVQAPLKGTKTLAALLSESKVSGQVSGEKDFDSGNPARDTTLFQNFFSLIAGTRTFEGSFNRIKGDDKTGGMNLKLVFNGQKKEVPMKYTRSEEGSLEASGEFNLDDFKMQGPLASLHKACEALHTGKDGVSKTWSNVGLKLSAMIQKDCAQK